MPATWLTNLLNTPDDPATGPQSAPEGPEPGRVADDTVAAIADALRAAQEPVVARFAELAQLLTRPTPVLQRPSDRVDFLTTAVPTTRGTTIPGGSLDQARLTLVNVSADDGPTIYLGATAGVEAKPGAGTFAIPVGATFTIETRSPLWAIAPNDGALLAVAIESYELR